MTTDIALFASQIPSDHISGNKGYWWNWPSARAESVTEALIQGAIDILGNTPGICFYCGSGKEVISYPIDETELTFCPEHCPEHDYEYSRCERDYFCKTCGQIAPYEWLEDRSNP